MKGVLIVISIMKLLSLCVPKFAIGKLELVLHVYNLKSENNFSGVQYMNRPQDLYYFNEEIC
jgi:hypothetical protein